jgi:acetylornithine deacetylase/succinyl-diaminopimelate desuccinylase-like protein
VPRPWTRREFLLATGAMGAVTVGGSLLAVGPFGSSEPSAARDPAIDFDPVPLASAMIGFNTSHNGEGGITAPHARWWADRWHAYGVPTEIVETPKVDNVHCIARIRGTGRAAPLLFLGHSDVVSVERERWTTDPFRAEQKDGYLYGRGALDMKGTNAAVMAALLRHLSQGARFDRDIVVVSDCDEEAAPYSGTWLATQHWDKVNAGAVLTEGGWLLARADGRTPMLATLTCQDKVYALLALTATGTTTHSSRPRPDSALVRLDRAIAKLSTFKPDVFVGPLARRHFEALAEATDDRQLAAATTLMLSAKGQTELNRAADVVVARSAYPALHNALIRPTVAFVIENAGFKANVIPGTARATINVRLPPGGAGIQQLVTALRAMITDESVVLEHVGAQPTESPHQADARVAKALAGTSAPHPGAGGDPTGVFAAWTSAVQSVHPGLRTTPTLFEAGTATGVWRARGIPVYGLYPYVIDNESMTRMHGNNERVGLDALRRSAELMYALFGHFRI